MLNFIRWVKHRISSGSNGCNPEVNHTKGQWKYCPFVFAECNFKTVLYHFALINEKTTKYKHTLFNLLI
jgi:hypothetical protein